jgi:hypothetical protein
VDFDLTKIGSFLLTESNGMGQQATPNAFAHTRGFDEKDGDVMTRLYVYHSHNLAVSFRNNDNMIGRVLEYHVANSPVEFLHAFWREVIAHVGIESTVHHGESVLFFTRFHQSV